MPISRTALFSVRPGDTTMWPFGFGSMLVSAKKWVGTAAGGKQGRKRRGRQPMPLALETLEARLTPDGKVIASSFFDGAVYEFNSSNGTLASTLVAPYSGA